MYIGIDIGTSSVKVLMVNHLGEKINEASESYPILMPKQLWTEQNPNDWLEKTLLAIKTCIKGYEKKVKAISFSGQMHGLVVLDENDEVIRPAILWNDQRTVAEVEYLNEVIGKDVLLKETGNIALTGFTLPKILWLKNNEEENFKKIKKVMLPKDYIAYKLTNVFASDVSDLSGTLLFNVEKRAYSEKMIKISSLNKNVLPKIYESNEVIGVVSKEMAKTLKLKKDVKVIIGGGDQAVGAIGTGAVSNNALNISLGTSGVVFVASDQYRVDDKSYLHSFAHANNKNFMMGVTLSAAGSFDWWQKEFNSELSFENLFNEVLNTPIEDTIFFLPYLSGERSPINDPQAKGTFVGFTLSHKKAHLTRAIVEGINYSLKSIYEIIKDLGITPSQVRVTGGGAKNSHWCQMLSDILNVNIETISINEGPALGAAILAMVGNQKYNNVIEASEKIIKVNRVYYPNIINNKTYENKFSKYLKLYEELKDFYKII